MDCRDKIQLTKWCKHLILHETIKKLQFYDKGRPSWRPSWISRLAQGYTLVIRQICII